MLYDGRMQRFFVEPAAIGASFVTIKDAALLHQMNAVLRMKTGSRFVALDGKGVEYECAIEIMKKDEARAAIIEKRENASEPALHVTLYQAMPTKIELFEFVLQKCTEIGVSEFVPMITERTERKDITKQERLARIVREAAEQSGRGIIPSVRGIVDFDAALREKSIILHEHGDFPLLSKIAPELKNQKSLRIFIGPEGGFTEGEIERAKLAGALVASLGPRILRTETAAVAAASLVLL